MPRRCCSMSAYTAPVSPTAVSTAPTTSILVRPRGTELVAREPGRQIQRDRQRHDVDPEDPPPAQRVDEDTSEQRADDESRSGPSGPGADRPGLAGAGEPGIDHRQRARHQECGADALQAAGGDQHPAAGRERTQQRRRSRRRRAPPAARPAARTASEIAPATRISAPRVEQIAVHHPLLQRQTAAEVAVDRGQREVDHRAVQERHERGQDRDREQRSVGGARGYPVNYVSRTASSASGGLSAARGRPRACACSARWAARMAR